MEEKYHKKIQETKQEPSVAGCTSSKLFALHIEKNKAAKMTEQSCTQENFLAVHKSSMFFRLLAEPHAGGRQLKCIRKFAALNSPQSTAKTWGWGGQLTALPPGTARPRRTNCTASTSKLHDTAIQQNSGGPTPPMNRTASGASTVFRPARQRGGEAGEPALLPLVALACI